MAGTSAGGKKASETNRKLHGKDFYARIGSIGGRNGHTGGFASNPELARKAGAKGGRSSARGNSFVYTAKKKGLTIKGSAKEIAKRLGYSQGMINHAWRKGKTIDGFMFMREEKAK